MSDKGRSKLDDYELGEEIARGSYGVVYKVIRKSDRRILALKQVNLKGADMTLVERQEAIDEARMLSQLNHPHIIKHYDSWIDDKSRLNILMEMASKGSLSHLIKGNKGKGLPEDLIWKYFIQSLLGLSYLHNKRIIHRDIKALNLFLDHQDNIKIGDLGIARVLSDESEFARTIVGTPFYVAPELCLDKPYNAKSDVWAIGIVLYECCMGKYPFWAENQGALYRKIVRGQYAPVSGPYTAAMVQMVNSLLTHEPKDRPDTLTLLKHPYVMSKAKALGIDMNPRLNGNFEDKPMYATLSPAGMGQQPNMPPARPQASAEPPSYLNYPPYNMAGGPQRPASAGAAAGAGGQPQHPFAHPSQQQQQPAGQYQQQQQQGGGGYQRPQQGQPLQHPFALQPATNEYDRMADEIHRMQIGTAEFKRQQQERMQQMAANAHMAQRDNMRDVLHAGYEESQQAAPRLRPEELPAAGGRAQQHRSSVPFALHTGGPPQMSMSQAQQSAVWTAKYSPPTYGRKRNPDLMITGPSLRANNPGRPGSAGGGGGRYYAHAADDATTYVSSSYNTSYYK